MKRQRCKCGAILLRRVDATSTGFVCGACGMRWVEQPLLPPGVTECLQAHLSNRGAQPYDFEVQETGDSRIAARLGNGESVTLTVRQVHHFIGVLASCARYAQDWIDESGGRYEWIVAQAEHGRFRVQWNKATVIAVPVSPRRETRCYICDKKWPAKSPMWRPIDTNWGAISSGFRFCDRCIKALSGVDSVLTAGDDMLAALQRKAEA